VALSRLGNFVSGLVAKEFALVRPPKAEIKVLGCHIEPKRSKNMCQGVERTKTFRTAAIFLFPFVAWPAVFRHTDANSHKGSLRWQLVTCNPRQDSH